MPLLNYTTKVDMQELSLKVLLEEIKKLTAENDRLTAENAKIDEYKCVIADISEQCKKLEAENEKLRTRLQNAVELKAKVGDTIYMPWVYDGTYDIAKLQIIGIDFRKSEVVYITDLQSDNVYYLKKYKFGIFRNEDFDNMVFTDYDKAEAKLKELQGGADND